MYRGFNLNITDAELRNIIRNYHKSNIPFQYCDYLKKGQEDSEVHGETLKDYLRKHCENMPIAGEVLEHAFFPKRPYHVFISHSSADRNIAYALAAFLKENAGLECFVDSSVWGYYKDLEDILYKHIRQQRNVSSNEDSEIKTLVSTHVHCMLSKSLVQELDESECLILLNTPNSIHIKDYGSSTFSPWIYCELEASRVLRPRKHPSRPEHLMENFSAKIGYNVIDYKVNTDHLNAIDGTDFETWIRSLSWNSVVRRYIDASPRAYGIDLKDEPFKALDALYKKFPMITRHSTSLPATMS